MVITIAVGIAIFAHDVIRLLAAPAFHPAGKLVPVVLLAYVFQAWSSTQDTGIRITERTGWDTVANWVSAVVALLGYVFLIPRYLGFGAAWATVFALGVRHIIIYVVSQRLWPVQYDWAPIIRLMLLAIVLTLLRVFLPRQSLVISVVTGIVLFAVYVVGLLQLRILPTAWRTSMGSLVRQPRTALLSLLANRN
jgi:O-antigen/teichoic acid export membrane protein